MYTTAFFRTKWIRGNKRESDVGVYIVCLYGVTWLQEMQQCACVDRRHPAMTQCAMQLYDLTPRAADCRHSPTDRQTNRQTNE